jgi:peptidyl-prolyl cis-trans isomerase SurA
MLKKVSALFFTLLALSNCLNANVGSIAAVVNDKTIGRSDLNHRVKMALLSSGAEVNESQKKDIEDQILQVMIDEILQLEFGEKYKIVPTATEIERSIELIEAQNNMSKGGLKQLLEKNNIPFEVMKHHVKAKNTWQDYIKARYSDVVQVSDQEVKNYIDNQKNMRNAPHYLLAEIYIPFTGNVDDAQKTYRYAMSICDKVRKGARFSAMAQQFSALPTSVRGGDIGWVTLGQLDPNVSDAVKGVAVGNITQPIKVEGGYYIILVRDFKADGKDIGRDTLITFQQALFPVAANASQESLQDVYMQASSFANQARTCDAALKMASHNRKLRMQSFTKIPSEQMPPELKGILMGLNSNKASQPILTPEGFLVFWTCAKEQFNPQDPREEDVRGMLMEHKLSLISQRELRNLHRGAVIEIKK